MSNPNVPPFAPKGVIWSLQPPLGLSASIDKAVREAVAELPKGANGALIGVATERGANLVVAQRLGDHIQVAAWVGKSGWDSSGPAFEAGASIKAVW